MSTPVLPSDHQLVQWAAATYDPANKPIYRDPYNAIRIFLFELEAYNVIAIEGTRNRFGWLIDFFALMFWRRSTYHHPNLGPVHYGFHLAAAPALPRVRMIADRKPYILIGHSLGAALALLLGAMLAIEGARRPMMIAAFAPPRVGGIKFLRVLAGMLVKGWRVGNDPVPLVPFTLPKLFPYLQIPLIAIGKWRLWPPACHHIQNYVAGIPA